MIRCYYALNSQGFTKKREIPESLSGLAKHNPAKCIALQIAGYRERMREAWLLLHDQFGPGTIPLLNFTFLPLNS